ncbi:uncharacterized protein BDZ83DRAFT_58017 [Colletotrichum acutatum]|uniref:Uncharacterized protein n=1 Tax=Glomerella acutata TaxID=27357 RepID=A0AAD8UEU4_GLOAC|nr:uncharacterized protein BDZ83DRAFT_58017 [Colletotrichum acutatum]KAK1715474.1 hypothetical protein BDZ83DRAFT_58017 [Colletotrichum acutatum]
MSGVNRPLLVALGLFLLFLLGFNKGRSVCLSVQVVFHFHDCMRYSLRANLKRAYSPHSQQPYPVIIIRHLRPSNGSPISEISHWIGNNLNQVLQLARYSRKSEKT